MIDPSADPSSSSAQAGPSTSPMGNTGLSPHLRVRASTDLRDNHPTDSELSLRPQQYNFDTAPPIFHRTISAPLPHRLGTLQHPFSHMSRPDAPSPVNNLAAQIADDAQSAIQILLHLSPPHILDDAKEQYSGCGVQVPTTSLSALLGSMRNLNYLAARGQALSQSATFDTDPTDFDVGELLQRVGDMMSGLAAQAGVDIVIYHANAAMKHVNVKGDAEGLSVLVSNLVRQVILSARSPDVVELSLSVTTQDQTAQCNFTVTHNTNIGSSPAETPTTETSDSTNAPTPNLDDAVSQTLLNNLEVTFHDAVPESWPRNYTLALCLPQGPLLVEPLRLTAEEEAIRQPFAAMQLAREPTLLELDKFVDTLRGKKVALHADPSSIFAKHCTSYLTAWGADTMALPIEDDPTEATRIDEVRFVLIDDSVTILKRELSRIAAEHRPFSNRPILPNRSISSPQVPQPLESTPALIHFTSIARFSQVRDVIANAFGSTSPLLSIIVIPKPVGPRRLLTALHTAVAQPLIDPSFSPLATSPRSPSAEFAHHPLSIETLADQATATLDRLHLSIPTPADVVATPATEYFSKASSRSSTGTLVIQSPEGRPFGMYFEPAVPPTERRSSLTTSGSTEQLRRRTMGRRSASGSQPAAEEPVGTPNGKTDAVPAETTPSLRRKTLPTPYSEHVPMPGRDRATSNSQRARRTPPNGSPIASSARDGTPKKTAQREPIVPPINVLIVEDNPINQNILSMFLRKKKIKHETAKTGLEAVEKWRTGGFHLILMDIQLPVMDGIEATKEIRKLERNNNIGIFPSTPTHENRPNLIETIPSSPLRTSVIIVALTASSLQSDRVVALAAGCNDFLTKPVSLKWLDRKIVEWGCMQALIDFDGWRRSKGDPRYGFNAQAQQAAKNLASKLRIERKATKGEGETAAASGTGTAPELSSISEDAEIHAVKASG